MARRHHIELSFIDGRRELLIDGQKVNGVRSTRVTLDANDIPHVHVELLPASVTFTGDAEVDAVEATLHAGERVIKGSDFLPYPYERSL